MFPSLLSTTAREALLVGMIMVDFQHKIPLSVIARLNPILSANIGYCFWSEPGKISRDERPRLAEWRHIKPPPASIRSPFPAAQPCSVQPGRIIATNRTADSLPNGLDRKNNRGSDGRDNSQTQRGRKVVRARKPAKKKGANGCHGGNWLGRCPERVVQPKERSRFELTGNSWQNVSAEDDGTKTQERTRTKNET